LALTFFKVAFPILDEVRRKVDEVVGRDPQLIVQPVLGEEADHDVVPESFHGRQERQVRRSSCREGWPAARSTRVSTWMRSRALAAMLDGVVLECVASGALPSRVDVERRALLLLGRAEQADPAAASAGT
jgi:hypothetical protein